jgi:hypothetical protein
LVLIIEDAASDNRYVRLLAYEDGSPMAETVSKINLGPPEQWDDDHERLLAKIGSHPPEDRKSPNWLAVYPTATPPQRR